VAQDRVVDRRHGGPQLVDEAHAPAAGLGMSPGVS
jgi:hypothetical protein